MELYVYCPEGSETTGDPTAKTSTALEIFRLPEMPYAFLWKIFLKALKLFPYKISHTRLRDAHEQTFMVFVQKFIVRVEVKDECTYNNHIV
ncbi:hypothetical protein AVEN_152391-1 [Araneus ventricosus]|uniref:Uncharacterized protein n=1 Tax=Araneus ventricosus TaxID=182803 RepID=A0A4Y2DD04_ARAVE|nr:hypothetical protein AVEN_152391-1 [Araneus ventricosus]